MRVIFSLLLVFSFYSIDSLASSGWAVVTPLPDYDSFDFSQVERVHYEVYDLKVAAPEACSDRYCFRAAVFVNGEFLAQVPTSPGRGTWRWGHRTPEVTNTTLAPWGNGFRAHGRGYWSSGNERRGIPRSNLRYFLVFLFDGEDIGVGFHGDKGGVYRVTGRPESHGCMRLTDSNARFFNTLARAALENSGGDASLVTLTTMHTDRAGF